MLDCTKYRGRLRDICRGHDDNGNPIDMPVAKQRRYRELLESGRTPRDPQPLIRVAEDHWPAWAKAVSKLRASTDRGVGDTVQRLAAIGGGELFKKLTQSVGLPCKCASRRADWNKQYSYSTDE